MHTADIHLDSPLRSLALRDKDLQLQVQAAGREILRKITDIAIEEEIAALLLAGDLFDSGRRTAQTLAFLRAELERLNQANISVFYIKGNHDAANPLLNMMDWPANVKIFSARGESFKLNRPAPDGRAVYLHGVSFSGRQAPNLLDKYPLPVPDAVNIGLMHTSLNGAAGHDVYAPCSVAELAAAGYDYWALGHIHKRAVYREGNSLIVMPGCPQGRDIGEDGAKSVTMLRLNADGKFSAAERLSAAIGFFRLELALNGAEDAEDLRAAIEASLRRFRAGCPMEKAVLWLRLSGATPLYWQLIRDRDYWQEVAAQLAAASGDLWIDALELDIHESAFDNRREAEAEANALPVEEFAGFMRAAAASPEFQAEALKNLNDLLSRLPPELRAGLAADKDGQQTWLAQMLAEGEAAITALLKGQQQEQKTEAD